MDDLHIHVPLTILLVFMSWHCCIHFPINWRWLIDIYMWYIKMTRSIMKQRTISTVVTITSAVVFSCVTMATSKMFLLPRLKMLKFIRKYWQKSLFPTRCIHYFIPYLLNIVIGFAIISVLMWYLVKNELYIGTSYQKTIILEIIWNIKYKSHFLTETMVYIRFLITQLQSRYIT